MVRAFRRETGCAVVAAERDGELVTVVVTDFMVETGGVLVAAGSEEATDQFRKFVTDEP